MRTKLIEAFGRDLDIQDTETFDGFVSLVPGPGFLHRLSESFDYVTDVLDDTAGLVSITGATRFPWKTYGELMEWFYTLPGQCIFESWTALTPFFVWGHTAVIHSMVSERWARSDLQKPAEDPSKYFVLRLGMPNSKVEIRLEMDWAGWAMMHVTLDDVAVTIDLSDVYDPFCDMAAWGREIDEGDLPIQFEIDEEGEVAIFSVLCTDDPERVLLRIKHKYSLDVLLEGVVSRKSLASALKDEMRRFFSAEFNPDDWELPNLDEDENVDSKGFKVKHPAMGNSWFAE